MAYEEFLAAWEEALRGRRLLSVHDRPEETIDVATMSRSYSVRVGMFIARPSESAPFTSSMVLEWEWDALMSARSRTTEEDLVTELLGSRKRMATQRSWLRVDVEFAGMLPIDHLCLAKTRSAGTEDQDRRKGWGVVVPKLMGIDVHLRLGLPVGHDRGTGKRGGNSPRG